MDNYRIIQFFNTVKYLKVKQVFFRLYYFLKSRVFKKSPITRTPSNSIPIIWENIIDNYTSFNITSLTFNFLNISHSFKKEINWNYDHHGKLWTYNLNYFDFLNQEKIVKEDGLLLIKSFIQKKASVIDGNEPYPISLRCYNWVKFLSKHKIRNIEIDNILYNDFIFLFKNLEYHLLGNHLLENAFSLLFGSYYFQDKNLYLKSKKLIKKELDEQILNDGGHFELSPMYHQTLLFRLLDCINLIKLNKSWIVDDFVIFLEKKASLMYSWLKHITYQNGDIPMVNDSTFMIAPSSKNLFDLSKKLSINFDLLPLSDSGYRKINSKKYELFIDVGNIGPDYQPGHSHSDTFNFELRLNKLPFLVDTGISTYEKNEIRQNERSTVSHNTVMINNIEQTDVWGGFRVGRRAKILNIIENEAQITANHNGYKNIGINHERIFKWCDNKIEIKDSLNKSSKAKAFFHLHSSINKPRIKNETVFLVGLGVNISFSNHSNIEIRKYKLSHGFNRKKLAFKIIVDFNQTLLTQIHL
tara:strand:- start:21 stop:1601 length:1581 start_codon:yes stop_codon:yes gene_type:complete